MADQVDDVPSTEVRRLHRHPSLVWAVPLIALLIGVWLVVQSVAGRGPTISISFHSAEGLEAGKTKIRYKDVDVGTVSAIQLSADRKSALVTATLLKSAGDLLVSDTRFFVVKPRISGGSVSGLGTLLSGAYISLDVGSSKAESRDFTGLEAPPLITSDSSGSEFLLRADRIGSLGIGSPVYFRRIQAGHVTQYKLDSDGKGVTVRLFVDAPYDKYVTTSSRFWQASGVDVALDASGFRVTTESVAAILEGGLAFEDREEPGPAPAGAAPETVFTLFSDRARALRPADGEVRTYLMYFRESLRGLLPGAPVDMHGILIGEVKSLGVEYGTGGQAMRFPVELSIYPSRLHSRTRAGKDSPTVDGTSERRLVDRLFAAGMRGQLKTGNLLTGQLYVALDFFPGARLAKVDWSSDPPVMPTVSGSLTELQDAVVRIVKKVDRIPIERMSADLSTAIGSLNRSLIGTEALVRRLDAEVVPEATATLHEAREALSNAAQVLSSDSPVQQDLHDALKQLGRSARSLGALADMLEKHPDSLIFGKKGGSK